MSRSRQHAHLLPCRGAALLIVLAVLVVSVTATLAMAQFASRSRLAARQMVDVHHADAALLAAEQLIESWLVSHAASIVLPPDAREPRCEIASDLFMVEGTVVMIRISAWDQQGMAHVGQLVGGSPLRAAVPAEVLAAVDRLRFDDAMIAGLDLFAAGDVPAFPASPAALLYRAQDDEEDPATSRSLDRAERTPSPRNDDGASALGRWVATHPSGAGSNHGINVNTAPIVLLEQAMLVARRGGLDLILEARREGRVAPVGSLPVLEAHRDDSQLRESTLPLVSRSQCWAFRIDVKVGSVQQRRWAVFQQRSGSRWTCVQRLLIDA